MKKNLWKDMVEAALADSEKLDDIYNAFTSAMLFESHKYAQRISNDLLQAGRMAIWRKLSTVDVNSKEQSIRAYLRRIAINAMRDEVRRLARQERGEPIDDLLAERLVDKHFQGRKFSQFIRESGFCNLLKMYAAYVRRNGRFSGAHKVIAQRLGISIPLVTRRFHAAARSWIGQEGLKPTKKKHARIIKMILTGKIR